MKFLLAVLALFFCFGCASFKSQSQITEKSPRFIVTDGDKMNIAMDIKVLDDTEIDWLLFRTRAELYLKVSASCYPGAYLLYPLNVKNAVSGSATYSFRLPYTLAEHKNGKIIVELLDDDELSDKETELILNAVKEGSYLMCDGIRLYSLTQAIILDDKRYEEHRRRIAKLSQDSAEVLIDNMNQRQFESLGAREYIVYRTDGELLANPLTVVDTKMKARCDIKFYLVP